jgi:ribonuclease P protein component
MPRLAVSAGRGFATAVARNRARRILREACRLALRDRGVAWDLILVARPEVLELPYGDRLNMITDLLQQAGVLGGKAASSV